jgi:hypothetical protein
MELDVTFLGLIVHNLRTRPLRSSLTAAAVAVGITTVLALGVLTYSLRETAVAIVRTGKADFTVAQEGVSDVLYSAIDEGELAKLRATPGVESVVGVLIGFTDYDAEHPLLIQLGLDPDSQAASVSAWETPSTWAAVTDSQSSGSTPPATRSETPARCSRSARSRR